jgi:protein O-mannosyl-transferase
MTAVTPDRSRGRWAAPLLVVILGIIAYSNSFHGPFVFDDMAAIVKNPQICSLNPFKYPPAGPSTIAGRPVVIFSFAANYAASHLKVESYHATNLVIHLLAGLTLYGIIRRTLLKVGAAGNYRSESARWLAAMAAALWVVHPLDTQSVTYIVQRAESLASLFMMLSLYCFIRAADGGRTWGILAVIACGLGMASKEIAAAMPILALLYDRAFLVGTFKGALARRWKIYVGMAATYAFILLSLHTGLRETMVGFHLGISAREYARTELNVIAHYLRLAFWPTDLVLDYYGWPIAKTWSEVQWDGWIVLVLAIATLIAIWRWPRMGFLGAWFFLILAPTSSFLPIKQEVAADQRMYAPLAAVICLVVAVGWAIVRRSRTLQWVAGIAGCLAIALLMRLTIQRNDLYAVPLDLWQDTIAKRPDNTRAHVNLGNTWAQVSIQYAPGSPEAVAAAAQAREQYQIALKQEPKMGEAIFAIGESLEHIGDPAAAEDLYTRSLPKFPEIRGPLLVERGNLRARRRDWADAKADFLGAIQAEPENPEPHYFLGVLYEETGELKSAEAELEKVVAITPKYKDAAARLAKIRKDQRQR